MTRVACKLLCSQLIEHVEVSTERIMGLAT